jgi:Fe-S cluster assembly protein SufD
MSTGNAIDLDRLLAGGGAAVRPWLAAGDVRARALRTSVTATTRELWKYTPLQPMLEAFARAPSASGARWSGLDQPGIRALPFSEAVGADRERLADLIESGLTADRHLLADVALLRGAEGLLIEIDGAPARPIELAHETGGTTLVALVLRPGAHATFIERQDAPPFAAQLAIADIGRDANLVHHRAALQADAGLWALIQARVDAGATYTQFQQVLGGNRRRMETHVALTGRGAAATLTGAYVVGDGHHLDQQTVIEHRAPDTTSRQRFHGIGTGRGRSVFNGRIHIHPHATRSDAWLSNRNLALAADVEMNTKPELEIYTDDVRCAHGATVGQLDADALFLLTARGIPEAAARTMLAHAFLRECIEGPLADAGTAALLGEVR